jgi:putative ABC transport system permease protein
VSRILLRAGARYHLMHRWQLLLALLGVTLGVAVVVAVDVATGSARRAFSLSTEAVTGRATHEITGGPAGIADSAYVRLRTAAPRLPLAPVIDRYITIGDAPGRVVRLLGVDPFSEAPFRSFAVPAAGAFDVGVLLTRRALALSQGTAAALGVAAGDTIRVRFGQVVQSVVIGGILEPADDLARRTLADVALADIATAQELTASTGRIDRIDVRAADGDAGKLDTLTAALPGGARITATDVRAGATARLTRAFDTNLTALALVALVFGMFLIYNSVSFSVVQRRPLLGLLRAQGVTARELFLLILAEAALLGVVATLLGLVVGTLLGTQLVRLVAGTINDLYFAVSVTSVRPGIVTLGKALLLGVGATLAAAAAPAAEALSLPARSTLTRASIERRSRTRAPRYAIAGIVVALAAAALLLAPSRSIVLGFTALFILILAAALVTPLLTTLVMLAVRPLIAMAGPVGRMAARGVTASLSRTAPAIAALGVALSVGIAVTLMITSFRAGVVRWLGQSLQADIYMSAPSPGANRTDVTLDPALTGQLRALPGVAGLTTYRHVNILLGDDIVRMIAVDLHDGHRAAFEILDGGADRWAAFASGGVLVSEPLAYRRGIAAGDSLTLPTGRGDVRVPVAAVFRDYASEHGVIFIDRARYDLLWEDAAVTNIAVFTTADVDADSVIVRVRGLPAAAGVTTRANRGLREATLEVFDRTFLITGVLRILALIVAFVGVTGALMALQLERSREIAVLRAAGLTPAQVWALATAQTALMGVAAVVLAVPLGIAMSWAMVHVINRRSFGWSFELMLGATPFMQAFAVGIGAALLAGIYPAFRMARMRPALALRGE